MGASTDGKIISSSPGPEIGSDSTRDTSGDKKDTAAQRSSNAPSLRRLACDACRNRKVRCDRQSPTCGRCVKIGNNCHYSSRARSTPSKMDLSRFLLTMNNRLRTLILSSGLMRPHQGGSVTDEYVSRTSRGSAGDESCGIKLETSRHGHGNRSDQPGRNNYTNVLFQRCITTRIGAARRHHDHV